MAMGAWHSTIHTMSLQGMRMTGAITTPAFCAAYQRTAQFEGGWSNDPDDRGGRTKYGVTQQAWEAYHVGNVPYDISEITRDDAQAVFWADYYQGANLHRLELAGCPQVILCDCFDACVNHGVRGGSKLLQRAYNLVCDKRPPLLVDGVIGTKTCTQIAAFCLADHRQKELLGAFRYSRALLFHSIVTKDPTQEKFIDGWVIRLL